MIREPFYNLRDAARSLLNRHGLQLDHIDEERVNKSQGIFCGNIHREEGFYTVVVCVSGVVDGRKPTVQTRLM